MNLKRLVLIPLIGAAMGASLASCGGSNESEGSNVVQIRVYDAGFGTDWLHEIGNKFAEKFPGKSIKIVEESPSVPSKVANEIQNPKNNNIDLYFDSGANLTDIIGKSQSVLRSDTETLLEPLDDVFNSKALSSEGKEEGETIKARMFEGYEETSSYHGKITKWQNKIYKLPWADAATGVFMNRAILNKYNLEAPITSNDFKNVIETIASHTSTDHIYPYAWAGNNAPGYWSYLFSTWFAQYSGVENFKNFMKLDPTGEGNMTTIKDRGFQVYQDQGILKALDGMHDILNINYSPNGSASDTHIKAQTKFATGECAFMIDGDWLLNEMKKNYFDQIKEIEMIKTPVLSSIIERPECATIADDAELKALVKSIDAGSKALSGDGFDVDQTAFNKVYEARSIHNCIGINHDMIIPSYADAKETAKLFIRFMYSNEGCRIFRNKAYANLPLKYTTEAGDADNPFIRSVDAINNSDKVYIISGEAKLNDNRQRAGILLFNKTDFAHPNTFAIMMQDPAKWTAERIFNDEYEFVQSKWSSWKNNF